MVRNREPLQVWEEDFPTTTGDTSSAGMLALALEERKKETTFFYGVLCLLGFPGDSDAKESAYNAGGFFIKIVFWLRHIACGILVP